MIPGFAALVDQLIAFNRLNRAQFVNARASLSALTWAMQYCTVHCDVGRGVGKTEYIFQRATEADLIIVPNGNMARRLRGRVPPTEVKYIVFPFVLPKALFGRGFETIYIDEPSEVFEKILAIEVYGPLVHTGDETFVLLGR